MQSILKGDQLYSDLPTQIGNYQLDKIQRNIENCVPDGYYYDGPGANCSVRHVRDKYVDNESQLLGITKKIEKGDPLGYKSYGLQGNDRGSIEQVKPLDIKQMQELNEGISTRQKRPCNVLSGVHIDRFEEPLDYAQNLSNIVINEPQRGGVNTRNNEKDCYVKNCGSLLNLKTEYGMNCIKYK